MEAPTAADEQRHASDGSPAWQEAWDLDFWTPDGALAGFLRVTRHGAGQPLWFVAALVGPGRRTVSVVDLDVPEPRRGDLELRATGLWVDVQCLVPYDHVTVGLECFGVVLDDPVDALGDGRGERVPIGLDLEWDTVAPGDVRDLEPGAAGAANAVAGYALSCRVHGEVLVADEQHAVDGWGRRSHTWGRRAWGGAASGPAAPDGAGGARQPPLGHGRLDDGRWLPAHMSPVDVVAEPSAWAAVPVPLATGADPASGDDRATGHHPASGAVVAWWRGSCILRAADGTRGHGWVHRIEEVPPR